VTTVEHETRQLLTVAEVADRLRLSRSSVYRLVKAGVLPRVWVSAGTLRIDAAELEQFIYGGGEAA
jgi:excisionase family DNA binding protein